MPAQVGTYSIQDLLAVRYQSVNEFGENTVVQVLQADLAAHNAVVTEMMQQMCEFTTDTQGIYGTGATGEMIEVDEFGRSETQKVATGSTVGYPLRLFQYATGWTRKYLQSATPADLAQKQLAAQTAHKLRLRKDIQRALFFSANYTFNDFLINNVALGVKRLVNADSASIPQAPDGSTFDASTHTHYVGASSLTTTVLTTGINNLIEHGHGARPMIAVHNQDATTVSNLTGFVPAQPVYLEQINNTTNVPRTRTDLNQMYNRLLGYYNGAEVWVKPWAIQNYLFIWDAGSAMKPLAFRQRAANTLQGLQIAAELEAYPLYAEYYEAEHGVAVHTRTNGVAIRFNNASYADPTIPL